ncbi:hypothetical protein GCM10009527_028140 [Actinomadura nitritigenes]
MAGYRSPQVRLHDLRHGAAMLGLAVGELKAMLRHSGIVLIVGTHTSVLPTVAHAAGEGTAIHVLWGGW